MLAPPAPPIIALVDDDADLRTALRFALEVEGFQVETFESGEALLLRAPFVGSACIVLDYRLPGIDGLETLRQLRRRGVETPVVVITGHLPSPVSSALVQAGARIVDKPLLGDSLVGAIRATLD